jgi:hypothetical protein
MAEEGMVDALRRAHRVLVPGGCLIDLHPTVDVPLVEIGSQVVGAVETGDGPQRHAAAGKALETAVSAGLFNVERAVEFPFHTYGDTIDELREYIEENWRDARIDDQVVRRAADALRAAHRARPCVREQVALTRLRRLPLAVGRS